MMSSLPTLMHRHRDGSAFPAQERVGNLDTRDFVGATALNAREQVSCVRCGANKTDANAEEFFQPDEAARRYPHLDEGVVITCFDRDGKQFGFLEMADGRRAYFPGLWGRKFVSGAQGIPMLATWPQQQRFKKVAFPKIGDRLLFNLVLNNKGLCAQPWGYADEYDRMMPPRLAAEKSDTKHSLLPFVRTAAKESKIPAAPIAQKSVNISHVSDLKLQYRIVEQWFYHDRNEFDDPTTLWEGFNQDFGEINQLFSPSYLAGSLNSTCNRIVWFEVFVDGAWKQCSDPRLPQKQRQPSLSAEMTL